MATVLRQFQHDSLACSVEELQARIGALAAARQQLRVDNAPYDVLEENRVELAHYLRDYNTDRVHHGRLTNGRIPADIVYGANKMKAAR